MSSSTSNDAQPQQLLSQFESLLDTVVRATSTASRASAEEKLSAAKHSNLLLYLECLLQLALKSKNTQIKQLSIVMFRQSVEPNNTNAETWDKIPTSAYNVFQNGLLTAMTQETDVNIYFLLCDAIGTLASRIIPKGYWKDLLSVLLELANKPQSFHKEGFLRVLDSLAEYTIEFLKPNFANISKVIDVAINDNNTRVCLSAYKAFISIVISLDNMDDIMKWKELIPKCVKLLNITDENALKQILSNTIDLVSHRFMLIQDVLDDILMVLVKISRNDNAEFETRKLAFETLVVMSGNNAALLRQHTFYMKNVVELSMYYLSLYDESISFSEIEDDIDQLYIWNGREWSNELAKKLGGNAYLSIAEPMIKHGLESRNWKQCYAALQIFIQIIKHIKDIEKWQMIEDDNCIWDILVPKILQFTTNNAIRAEIKHSALFVIKILINNYNQVFQERYYVLFYETMIAILSTYKTQHCRVLKQCLKCISYFNSNGAEQNQLRPSADIILKHLLLIVSDRDSIGNDQLIGYSVTCIGTCAHVMKSYFLPYYDKMMPVMIDIISNNKLNGELRGKAMESIGVIGESVGNMRFMEDAHKLMKVLLPFRDELKAESKQQLDNYNKSEHKNKNAFDNSAYNYLNQLFARISRCIGDVFIQYLPHIIPHLLSSASIDAAQILSPSDAAPIDPRFSVFTVHLRGIGDTKFCINPISLDDKDTSCHMLYQFVKDQCIGFFPFVLETAVTMKSLMNYQYAPRVRTAATTIFPLLLKCIIKGINNNNNNMDNKHKESLHNVFYDLFEPFMSALLSEPDVVETVPLLEILGQIASVIAQSGGFWSFEDKQLLRIATVLETLLSESLNRSKARMEDAAGNKLIVDEEKRNDILWANDIESELIAHIIDVCEYVFKASKHRFCPFFDESGLANTVKSMLYNNPETDVERLQSLCIFIDCIEFGGEYAFNKYMKWFYPLIVQYIDNEKEDSDIKQTAIYGIGILAKCGYLQSLDPTNKYLGKFIKDIEEFNSNNDAQNDDDDVLIYENMVSVIGKIVRYMNVNNKEEMLSKWIKLLPITNDEEEFNSITDNLLFFTQKCWDKLMLKNNECRSRILFCLLYYLSRFKDHENLTSYQLIMDHNIDLSDTFPSNIPVLNRENILKIKQLKENAFLVKCKAFEDAMQRLQPQEIQNIQYVVNKY